MRSIQLTNNTQVVFTGEREQIKVSKEEIESAKRDIIKQSCYYIGAPLIIARLTKENEELKKKIAELENK